MFESVPWDDMLRPRRWKPVSTMEQRLVLYPKKPQSTKLPVYAQVKDSPHSAFSYICIVTVACYI